MIFDHDLAHRFLELYDQGVIKRDAFVDRMAQCFMPSGTPLIPEVNPDVYRRAMKIWPDE